MALYYVTGQAGTGKTTVCDELRHRGFTSYDTDNDALAKWVNKHTGFIHPKSSVKPAQRTPQFLEDHNWKVPRSAVTKLSQEAQEKPVFLCGVGGNESDFKDLCRRIFALVIDDDTMRYRLATRSGDNSWGKQPYELELTLGWQQQSRDDYKKFGHMVIDATQPLSSVVDVIVSQVLLDEN